MAEVHQIYVTHCTHGSSALERREGDLAGRMLGYSARAGSLEAVELRRYYRLIERYVYYYLPRDTPAEDKLSLTAASAPRRLIFLPATGGLQLVGQVCYRPTDTQGRPGSYFAHVLWQECREGTPAWSPAECLRLWNAQGWAQEDRDEIPFLLPTLSSIDDVLQGHRPAIDDRVLRSFLTAEGPASLDDPARVIPPRWRDAPPVLRQQLFQQVFEAVLQHGLHERQGVLLLAEAELAALLLYGVTRLVPLGELSRTISFSTFEPNPDRLCTMLSATQFRDPKAVDLRPETYRGPGPTVINTFAPRQEAGQPSTPYVGWIVQRLLGEGWESADLVLSHLARCEPRSVEDLHHAAQADRCATMLLAGTAPGGEDWRRGFAAEYLGHALRHGLERLAHDPAALQRLAGTPAQVPLIDLAGTQRDAECRPAVVHLLRNLPDGWIGDVCRLGRVTREDKLALLLRYVSAHGQWPCEADWIWEPSRSDASFLPDLLGHLDSGVAAQLYRQTAIEHHPAFLLALLAAGRQKGSRLPALSHVIRMIDDDNLVELFLDHAEIRENYPADEPVLSERLQKLVLGLPFPAAGFARRLALILECQARLGDERLATVARHWEACRRQIVVLGRLQTQIVSVTRRRPWAQIESAFRTAVEAAHAAMPEDLRDDARPGAMKLNWLRQLGPALLGGAELLGPGPWRHAALWEKARRYFA